MALGVICVCVCVCLFCCWCGRGGTQQKKKPPAPISKNNTNSKTKHSYAHEIPSCEERNQENAVDGSRTLASDLPPNVKLCRSVGLQGRSVGSEGLQPLAAVGLAQPRIASLQPTSLTQILAGSWKEIMADIVFAESRSLVA